MSKKSIDKAARQMIIDGRENGKTDQEIYNELTQEYYDKAAVAGLITATPLAADKLRYDMYNNILLALLAIAIILRIYTVYVLAQSSGQPWLLLLTLAVPVVTIYFMYEIYRFNAYAYRFCAMMSIIGFLRTIQYISKPIDIAANFLFAVAVAGLALYLDQKLFPKYSPGKLKKDSNGEYILS